MTFRLLGFCGTVELSGLKLGMLFDIRCALRTSDYLVIYTFQYKLYEENESEGESFNNYCMCHLEGVDRTMACFTIILPSIGSYYIRSKAY